MIWGRGLNKPHMWWPESCGDGGGGGNGWGGDGWYAYQHHGCGINGYASGAGECDDDAEEFKNVLDWS
jgi:hypothetical protein